MNPKSVVLLALLLLISTSALVSQNKTESFIGTGWISDERCANKVHDNPACPRKCEDSKRKLVFIPDGDKTVLLIRNQVSLKGRNGQYVRLTGKIAKKTILVESVEKLQPSTPSDSERQKIGPAPLGPMATTAPPHPRPSFAADAVVSVPSQPKITAKWYCSLPKTRVDIEQTPAGASKMRSISVIADASTKKEYLLIPEQKQYVEGMHSGSMNGYENAPGAEAGTGDGKSGQLPRTSSIGEIVDGLLFSPVGANGNPCEGQHYRGCKQLRTESFGGRICDVWEITDDNYQKTTLWIDRKLHFPIRAQGDDGATIEFTNIKEGQPDDSFFKIPSDYHRLGEEQPATQPKK